MHIEDYDVSIHSMGMSHMNSEPSGIVINLPAKGLKLKAQAWLMNKLFSPIIKVSLFPLKEQKIASMASIGRHGQVSINAGRSGGSVTTGGSGMVSSSGS